MQGMMIVMNDGFQPRETASTFDRWHHPVYHSTMSRIIIFTVAPIFICCAVFLLLAPMSSIATFINKSLGALLFPRLAPYHRYQKLVLIAAVILASIGTAGITALAIHFLNRHPHR